jgi:hypothetical protein
MSEFPDVIVKGSGPGGALTDAECAKFYRKSLRQYHNLQANGAVPAPFYIGRTKYTAPSAIARDLAERAKRASEKKRTLDTPR